MDTETLTCKVCEARADYGITQQQLADATGISVRSIDDYILFIFSKYCLVFLVNNFIFKNTNLIWQNFLKLFFSFSINKHKFTYTIIR